MAKQNNVKSGYAEKLAKGGIYVTIIYIVGAIVGYGLRILISRNLSVEEFGVFYSILAFVASFYVFKDFGLLTSIAVKIPEFLHSGAPGKVKEIIKKSILIQIFASIVMVVLALTLSSVLMPNLQQSSVVVLQIILASFVISVITDIFRSSLQGTKRLVAYSSIEPIRVSIIFIASYMLFSVGFGIAGVAISYLIASVVLAVCVPAYFFMKNRRIFNVPSIKTSRDEFMNFTMIVWLAALFSSVLSYVDTLLLAVLRAPKEAGFYQVALPTAQLLTFLLTPIAIIILPFVSEMWAKKEKNELSKMAGFSIKILLVLIIPAIVVMEAISQNIIIFLFGDKFAPAVPVLQVLIIGMLFYSFIPLLVTLILGTNNPKENIKIWASMGIINIVLDIIFIPLFGPMGAATSLTIAYFVGVLVAFRATKKTISITIQYKNIIKSIIGGLIILVVLHHIKILIQFTAVVEALILIVIATVLYSMYIFAVKIVDKKDIELIRSAKILPNVIVNLLEKISRN